MVGEVQRPTKFEKGKAIAVTEEKLMEESWSTIPSDEKWIDFAKLTWFDSYTKRVRGTKSKGEDLQVFFSDMAIKEDERE